MADKQFDLIVIGGGPGGYAAAIRAAQLDLKTLLIDDRQGSDGKPAPGGTCLNVGCVPSKALLDSSKHFHHIQHDYTEHGISVSDVRMDVAKMIERKRKVVKQLNSGLMQLFKANKIEFANGWGKLLANRVVEVSPHEGETWTAEGKHVMLAAGSVPFTIPNVEIDGEYIVDNEGVLEFDQVPKRFGVIGAGVIGLEMGSVWSRLGSEVVLLEAMDELLGVLDTDVVRAAAREFKKQGLDIRLGARVSSATVKDGQVVVSYQDAQGEHSETFDRLLVAVGRRAATEGLLAEDAGIKLTDRGQIDVDDDCRTSVENVWAIGDIVRGPMLAHKASEEGIAVVEKIATGHGHINFETIPWVIYTDPEIAWVGKTERQLKDEGIAYKAGSFPFAATGRGLAMGHAAGHVKVLADEEDDTLLGVQIIGPNASELIAECVVAMEFHGCAEDLARIVHAHPTLSEAVHEAALAVDKRAIHKAN
ncbi:dihydrolipoyl dehydrogenase [Wenzhouxiangella marina]|uniref:Dihydrolipoyl dehydrogenase n=1 Tax=Wenzhouxiangella marina TaxID=1579979 RepID=A0A0K0XW17_9GAMM|nr:dihydrolipoyl dehydrogenase [Wenzhouxiangella marina]AKS41899.1 Dihydrolipoamide dehydrogenase [Wenzhouxiangella marina]MBB6086334.1 dihydrolipoamide dehydrogenase [Wenzhouxiangella marina]